MKITQTTTITIPKQNNSTSKSTIDIDALAKRIADMVDMLNAKQYEKEFKKIRAKAVNAFYRSYSPRRYRRKFSLMYMAYPSISDNEFFIDLGVDTPGYFANHHQDEELIYQWVFKMGYHGGSPSSEGVTARWRTPYPSYWAWGQVAPIGPSPYELLKSGWENFLNGKAKTIQQKNAKYVVGLFKKEIMEYINSLGGEGK